MNARDTHVQRRAAIETRANTLHAAHTSLTRTKRLSVEALDRIATHLGRAERATRLDMREHWLDQATRLMSYAQ